MLHHLGSDVLTVREEFQFGLAELRIRGAGSEPEVAQPPAIVAVIRHVRRLRNERAAIIWVLGKVGVIPTWELVLGRDTRRSLNRRRGELCAWLNVFRNLDRHLVSEGVIRADVTKVYDVASACGLHLSVPLLAALPNKRRRVNLRFRFKLVRKLQGDCRPFDVRLARPQLVTTRWERSLEGTGELKLHRFPRLHLFVGRSNVDRHLRL